MPEPQILLTGLAIGESPRWHEDRLWFSNWGTQEIVAVDLEGNSQVVGPGPGGLAGAARPRARPGPRPGLEPVKARIDLADPGVAPVHLLREVAGARRVMTLLA